ncbi:universal stress protein [Halarcobacter sp.]|uniref:universal stress protein n=1 Tax=Halarcobacter sp. TaxID=2321133 RepID=UPI0029F4F051|nr:universal stress protein [Halarcobacter sp.]
MFKKILVPTDGSDQANKALELACQIALKNDSQINILSVFRHHSFIEGSLSMLPRQINDKAYNLEDALGEYSKEIVGEAKEIAYKQGLEKENVKGFVRIGQIAKEILEFIEDKDIDIIIIGKQGKGDLSGYLLGGVSHKVAGLADIPVLVV